MAASSGSTGPFQQAKTLSVHLRFSTLRPMNPKLEIHDPRSLFRLTCEVGFQGLRCCFGFASDVRVPQALQALNSGSSVGALINRVRIGFRVYYTIIIIP